MLLIISMNSYHEIWFLKRTSLYAGGFTGYICEKIIKTAVIINTSFIIQTLNEKLKYLNCWFCKLLDKVWFQDN